MATYSNFILLPVILLFLQNALACQPPDCNRPDCGTCGNACCTLKLVMYGPSTVEVNELLVNSLKTKGADGRYRYVDSQDLRPYNVSAHFIIQGVHSTLVHHYNDTMNLVVYPEPDDAAVSVTAFSISQIAGAYCDSGQNYKNIIGFIKGLGVQYVEVHVAGCAPAPDNSEDMKKRHRQATSVEQMQHLGAVQWMNERPNEP